MGHLRRHVAGAAALLLVLSPAAASAASPDAVGTLTYAEGSVSVERDGAAVESAGIGGEIQDFDEITTGPDGIAEIVIGTTRAPAMTLKVAADTQFTIEIAVVGGKQQTTLGVIGGSLALKVAKLTGAQQVNVKTDSATMGVRGTSFTVTAAATGDVLVDCDEGDVLTTDDQGRQAHAVPGTIVEKRAGETPRLQAVAAAALAAYRAQWTKDRGDALRANALKLIAANARLHRSLARDLAAERAILQRNQAILAKWQDENRRGVVGARAEAARERAAVGAVLGRMRRIQFQLERVDFRLQRLRALHQEGVGVGTIDPGLTTTAFFAQLAQDQATVNDTLALTRFASKLYAKRADGGLPD